ncbi:TauD/TfdA family dioxygenase [Nocardioides massiliensis]|uniref:Alpha-ketoglutarate-dependent taurine dioxygenase n=1 Tax=Nocardioides massiliensis TaxID=1325935 RepID=A0ABT9NKU9_9ACTN|nr:TauD/TfdA family dioxygenase [Nocardioides massiliensis]MDP9821052.1 alpha-ketoglutarate-dependent taurine dioxygenase [Nocardioides massiliensis]
MDGRPTLAEHGVATDALRSLMATGFATFQSRRDAQPAIASLGIEDSPTTLVPKPKATSDPWSHSDLYGYGAFPWHTDGAVATTPPRWMVLECERLERASHTELLDLPAELLDRLRRLPMRVRDRNGRVRFLSAYRVVNGVRCLRWDPRVCVVKDTELSHLIGQQPPTVLCEWAAGRVVIVDNWRLLHRRPAVDPGAARTLLRTYVRTH